MNASKRNILSRLRGGLNTSVPKREPCEQAPVQQRDRAARVERFCQMMEAVHTEIHHTTESDWLQVLGNLLVKKGVESLLTAPATDTGAAVMKQRFSDVELVMADRPLEEWKDQLFNGVDAAITGSRGGIAETGTIVLWPSAEEPRAMSLVPPIHFVLVRADSIRNTFAETMKEECWQDKMPTNALLISGPSKTADIQQTLAYGAHGPKELVVLLVQGSIENDLRQ